jgi:hypothetical protein
MLNSQHIWRHFAENAKGKVETLWALLKGYWRASGKRVSNPH